MSMLKTVLKTENGRDRVIIRVISPRSDRETGVRLIRAPVFVFNTMKRRIPFENKTEKTTDG